MKKLILLILSSLILSITAIVPAGYAELTNQEDLQACIQECLATQTTQNQAAQIRCTNQCRGQLGRESYIPPTPKPTLLPGPNFLRRDAATVGEVTDYVTIKLLPRLAARFVTFVAVVSMLGLVYAGILYFTAFGDPEKGTKAKNAAIYSVVGLILALLSFTIVQIIVSLPI